jgi:PKD domain
MKKAIIISLYLILCSSALFAQLQDNTWIFGYNNNLDTTDIVGITKLTFPNARIKIEQNPNTDVEFTETNASISDSSGSILNFCNGYSIYGPDWNVMDNGLAVIEDGSTNGNSAHQYALTIPFPEQPDKYIIFYQSWAFSPVISIYAQGVYCAIVDMNENNHLGRVVERKRIILEDTIRIGHLTTCKHANGRDWWLLINKFNTTEYYRILITPDGIINMGVFSVGIPTKSGVGQSYFSPDGNFFCAYNAVSSTVGSFLDVYRFDRCTGLLSNHAQLHRTSVRGGVVISPNARYLYNFAKDNVYQFDLFADDVLSTETLVGTWDGWTQPQPTRFYVGALAPDGRIYAATISGTYWLHVIHNPDEPGMLCNLEQRGVRLPTINAFSIPNHPHFRLGPLDGSACDTLGIDNLPRAWWRYEQDTLNPNHVVFRDLSYYEPTSWSWSFGDGNTSSDRHPDFTYPLPGTYEVCLTVSNQYGTDTHCQTIYGVTPTQNPTVQASIAVAPNPFSDYFDVTLSTTIAGQRLRVYDLLGRLMIDEPLVLGVQTFSASTWPTGHYIWQVYNQTDGIVKSGKMVRGE